ncbi:MAG TPA: S24 family peptidase [Saprospiraceae bacterium]|nr:S24 family peptidase [Saprospiraceae bacterium]HMP25903.1 S24 family peptidase [Saprospiraceae bacterium]
MSSLVTIRFIECHNQLRDRGRVRSSRQFALALDYLPQSLSEMIKGRRDVTIELIRKAVALYQFNPGYLFTGEGPPFLQQEVPPEVRTLTIVTDSNSHERIVHVPASAQEAYAAEAGNPAFVQQLPTYTLPDQAYQKGTYRSFDIANNSMEPTLVPGDKVIGLYVAPAQWTTAIKDNNVYVVVTHHDVSINRVVNKIAEDEYIELHSDNNMYDRQPLLIDTIREVWHVRSRLSNILPDSAHQRNHQLQEQITVMQQLLEEQSKQIQRLLGHTAEFSKPTDGKHINKQH